jgi:hypothetical protein
MYFPQFIIKTQLRRVLHHQARPLQELSFDTHSRGISMLEVITERSKLAKISALLHK